MSRIRTLCLRGRFLDGTVTRTRIGNSLRMTVTDKADGKTRTLFVPKEHQGRVSEWVENWRLLKAALRELGELTVKQYFDDNGKIDCELTAFKVLARRIKRMFPRLSICVVGDALYACQPVMRICEDYGWKYVLTFKKGRTPAAYAESEALMRLVPGNAGDMSVRAKDGGREAVGDLAWAKDVTLGEGKGVVSFNVVRCAERAKGDGVSRPGVRRERINDKPPYRGCFATNFDVWDADSASDIVACGRLRWNIENNFKVEKSDYGFGLEHVFCNHWRCSRNFYVLMQLANNLWQMFKAGCLPRLDAAPGTLRSTTGRTSWRRCSSSSA